jgi:UDP-glucose 4-epimerase
VGGRLTIDGDPLGVAVDLAIDSDLFNWLVKARRPPSKVVYFSSSAVYPIALQTEVGGRPLSEPDQSFEQTIGMPDMTYGWAKLTGELLAQFAARKYGLDVVIYRPFSGYGEEQDTTYPFPSIVRRVLARETPLVVWGSGRQARDFIHIEDVVDTVLVSMQFLSPGEAMNIGSGEGISFTELAEMACAIVGHDARIINDASKPEGVFYRVSEISKMKGYWSPKISLQEGLEMAIASIKA